MLEGPASPSNLRRLGGGPSGVTSSSPESDVSSFYNLVRVETGGYMGVPSRSGVSTWLDAIL